MKDELSRLLFTDSPTREAKQFTLRDMLTELRRLAGAMELNFDEAARDSHMDYEMERVEKGERPAVFPPRSSWPR